MTITEFLEARIAEDEAAVYNVMPADVETFYDGHWADGLVTSARLLAECVAKRAIIAAHTVEVQLWWDEQCEVEVCAACQADSYPDQWPCPTICALAAVYADHEDYRQEWAL